MSTATDALPDDIPKIIQALEAIHNPRSTNEVRHDATTFLEQAKQSPHALSHGFSLASDSTRETILRHFGLSMMTFHLKYVYQGGAEDLLKEYVLRLTETLKDSDPPFLRNKVAQIWTEVVKRIWGPSWQDMDEQLVKLWSASSPVYSDFVLTVLETLSEDIFNQEDYVAGLRADLGSAFARICITEGLIEQHYVRPDEFSVLRYGKDGWFQRICTHLKMCLDRLSSQDRHAQYAATKAFSTLQSICPWIPPKCLISTSCVEGFCYALTVGDTQIRSAATEALCCVFARVNVDSDDMSKLLAPMFSRESLRLLHDAFSWASSATPDNDEEKYGFAKKLSEVGWKVIVVKLNFLIFVAFNMLGFLGRVASDRSPEFRQCLTLLPALP
jgi:exportin-5